MVISLESYYAQVNDSGQFISINGGGKVLCANMHPI